MNLQKTIAEQISVKTEQIKDKQHEIDNFEKELDEEIYDNLLDELYEPYKIGCYTFYPSRILSELDPIAYRCGMNDFVDSMELNEFPAYNDLVEELETLQSDLEDLEYELEELESGENESEDNEND